MKKFRIVIRCGFYIVQEWKRRWYGREWVSLINQNNNTLFPTFGDAKSFLDDKIKGYKVVYDSQGINSNGEYEIEISK